jgi:outer membrane lipoprotein SlyB
MQRNLTVLVLFMATALASCASQGTSSGGTGSTNVVDMNGCKVDPAPICDRVRGQSITISNTGLTADPGSRMVEQNLQRTANIYVPIKRDDGVELFQVECGINTLNQSVSWAHIMTGPKLTDDDIKYLRAHGLCSEL